MEQADGSAILRNPLYCGYACWDGTSCRWGTRSLSLQLVQFGAGHDGGARRNRQGASHRQVRWLRMTRAAIYIRVSTEEQAEEGYSLEAQQNA